MLVIETHLPANTLIAKVVKQMHKNHETCAVHMCSLQVKPEINHKYQRHCKLQMNKTFILYYSLLVDL